MQDPNDLKLIEQMVNGLLNNMAIGHSSVLVLSEPVPGDAKNAAESVSVNIATEQDPQILIGQDGQTLADLQRIIRMLVSKKLQKVLHITVDVNEYKKKKIDYLKNLAKNLADEVSLTGEKKILYPMSSFERRVVHAELSGRKDVATESHGEGPQRCVAIKPV